jgi:hypothetical protein
MLKGSCLCGVIEVTAARTAKEPAACHCAQCRKQSGQHWASVNVPMDGFTLTGEPRWFEASPVAKREFCATCGSFLFWKAHNEDEIGVTLGALDGPTGLVLSRNIFAADKGEYYNVADDGTAKGELT